MLDKEKYMRNPETEKMYNDLKNNKWVRMRVSIFYFIQSFLGLKKYLDILPHDVRPYYVPISEG